VEKNSELLIVLTGGILSVNITVFVQHVSAPNEALKISSQYDKEARVFANPGKPCSPCEPPGVHQHCL
jgi:hypothetical protein